MPGAYTVAYIYQDYDGIALYIYNGNRNDHHGDYERRVYRTATTIDQVSSAHYEVGYPYRMDAQGFYQAHTEVNYPDIMNAQGFYQAPTYDITIWWRVVKSWLVGGPVKRAVIAIALAYIPKKATRRLRALR